MAMTLENVTAFVRSLLGETSARYWTDAEITLYIQMAKSKVQAQFFPLLWDQFKSGADFGMTAGTSLYNYPTDATKIVALEVKADGKILRKIGEDEFHRYADATAGDPTAWTLVGGQIRLFPVPSTTDADYLYCWYMKNLTITATTPAVTDFPDVCKSLIAIEAVILGRGKDNAITADILELRKIYEQNVMVELSAASSAGQYL
jgi:hypothetical protein